MNSVVLCFFVNVFVLFCFSRCCYLFDFLFHSCLFLNSISLFFNRRAFMPRSRQVSSVVKLWRNKEIKPWMREIVFRVFWTSVWFYWCLVTPADIDGLVHHWRREWLVACFRHQSITSTKLASSGHREHISHLYERQHFLTRRFKMIYLKIPCAQWKSPCPCFYVSKSHRSWNM